IPLLVYPAPLLVCFWKIFLNRFTQSLRTVYDHQQLLRGTAEPPLDQAGHKLPAQLIVLRIASNKIQHHLPSVCAEPKGHDDDHSTRENDSIHHQTIEGFFAQI